MTRVIQKPFIALNLRFFAPQTPYSIQTGRNLPDVRDLKNVCCLKLSTIWPPKSNDIRPEILGFHSREKAKIKMETF